MRYRRRPGVDLGFEYSGELSDFGISALFCSDTVCHLGAVPLDSLIDL